MGLRETFEEDADLYDRVRPGYPHELFQDLARLGRLGPGSRVLEIGVGTGQATAALAARGYRVVGVELGPRLAAVARRRLAPYGTAVEIHVSSFEDWPLPAEPFDAVVAATSFHWVDPVVRVQRAADALRPGGVLATISTDHVAGGDAALFEEAHDCYLRWDPETTTAYRNPPAAEIPSDSVEIDVSGRFGPVTFRRYEWERTYSTAEYLDVLRTYSGHRALPPEDLSGLLECIRGLIDERYGGRVTKRYLNQLRVTARLPGR